MESSSQEDEIVVDPTNLVIEENQGEEPVNTQESADASNNNETQPKPAPATASHGPVTNSPDRKIQVHKVPVSFPAGGNLMEYPRTNVFITEALSTIVPDILPGNVIVHASLKDQMTSGQAVATVVLELKSSEYHDLIVKKIREWYANDNIPRTEKYRFYVTDFPQRATRRSMENSDSEKEPKSDKGRTTEKKKRKPSKDEENPDQKRRRRGSPKPSSSREKESPKRESRTTRRETKSSRSGDTKPGATAREHRDVQAEEKIRVYREQREAIKAKLAHQDRETQNLIDRQAFGHKTQAHETKSKMKVQKGKPQGSPKPGKSKRKRRQKVKIRPRGKSPRGPQNLGPLRNQ